MILANIQLVVFALDNQEYGIDVLAVDGILRSKKFKIQLLPGTPDEIEGIINLRGQIKYLYNLRNKFHLMDVAMSDESKFVMLNVHDSIAGLMVDEVTDIVKMDDADLEQTPASISGFTNHYIKGIGKVDERLIIILDPEKLLAREDFESFKTTENEAV